MLARADVVLMIDAPTKVVEAIKVACQTHPIVWKNITFTNKVKGLFIALGIVGLATMWEAIFNDVSAALITI